jgi:muramoyltetrapeptide carboxypeptidase
MITPDFLKPGDKIGIVAPSRKVSPQELEPGIRFLQDKGFEVVLGKNVYGSNNQFSGTDNERCADFQSMIDDRSIRAIIAARGGYGAVRIIDDLELDPLMDDPKWLCGFSDLTVMHNHFHHYLGMETIHSCMMFNFTADRYEEASAESLVKTLMGEKPFYEFPVEERFAALNKQGGSEGLLVGGNLSMLYSMLGTASDIDTRGKILFIEDLDEYLYHIDRMMIALKRAGKLANLVGLIAGGMNEMKDNAIPFGKTAEEIIRDVAGEYEYPICFGFPAGHIKQNYALILGREADLNVDENNVSLSFLDGSEDHT